MGPTGIEPATSRLRAKRSARLSYGPHEFFNKNNNVHFTLFNYFVLTLKIHYP